MTPQQLRAARIAEAWRISDGTFADTMGRLADLYETNWTPPEPVDPDLLAAREWMKTSGMYGFTAVESGAVDDMNITRAYLAGCTRGREGTKGLVEAAETLVDLSGRAARSVSSNIIRNGLLDELAKIEAALASAKRGG